MNVYFDNAATTPLDAKVIEEMHNFMLSHFGNPSSVHSKGREARVELEKARKKISAIVGARDKEIIFTSGGTEANNFILKSLALDGPIKRIITSPLEHHSILDTLDWIKNKTKTKVQYLNTNSLGQVDIAQLEELLGGAEPTLVTLMHGNNEIGNLIDLKNIGEICHKHDALFHTDMVQTFGHYPINLNDLPIDFATASAHKIHGPKGVGFIYISSKRSKVKPIAHGGTQERGIRGGTENIIGIMGMATAFEIANSNHPKDLNFILSLKKRMIEGLQNKIPNIKFNGESCKLDSSLYTLLSIRLPSPKEETLLFNLDLKGIALSEGSACSTGASKGSHVLMALEQEEVDHNNLRISFSKFNSAAEVDYTINSIKEVLTMV